jgi:hypothetical protein
VKRQIVKQKPGTSRPLPRPDSGKIAVKVINEYGDEVV